MNVVTTGAQTVYNHRSIQRTLNDQYINMQAFQALNYRTNAFKDANISVATYNQEVLLTGQALSNQQKQQAEEIIKHIDDVKEVHNLITVSGPASVLTRISDAWITSKVKARLIASNDVDATQIKVTTENGIVYLMGVVPAEEAEAAVDLANDTDGVVKVVKLFSYVTITKQPNPSA